MEDKGMLKKELEEILYSRSLQELFECMERNIVSFFSTPDIPDYYHILKGIDTSSSKNPMPRLMMAWLAFLSGDNANLFSIMKDIRETELCKPRESSMFYALKALVGSMMNSGEGLRYARLALDVLPEDEESFFMANAKLTLGQLFAGSDQYRLAYEMFEASYRIFHLMNLHFLSTVALVNELLNRYKLGEFAYVIDKCSEALTMSASFREEMQSYWDIVHLPLGMCYYELNKPSLAIRHLMLAKASIDEFKLFHMHGLIEIYLFKSYYILGDSQGMKSILEETTAKFGYMHYKQLDLIISMF